MSAELERVLAIEERIRIADATMHLDYLLELVAEHEALAPEDVAQLRPFAEELSGYWARSSSWDPGITVFELACLVPGRARGRDPVGMLVQSIRGFRERWLDEATWPLANLQTLLRNFDLEASDDPVAELRRLERAYTDRARPDEELRITAYRELSDADASDVAARATEALIAGDESWDEALLLVSALVPSALQGLHEALADAKYCERPELYRGAPSSVSEEIIELLDTGEGERDALLLALAWVGDDTAVSCFAELQLRRPAWAESMALDLYPSDAGWEIDESGRATTSSGGSRPGG